MAPHPPPAPERQSSSYSLAERHDATSIINAAESITNSPQFDDGKSEVSSRSDQSEEAAGLVSRLSDEEDRANRRAKYEGGNRLGTKSTHTSTKQEDLEDGEGEEDDDLLQTRKNSISTVEQNNGNSTEREHSITPSDVRDGVFRDRAGTAGRANRRANRRGFFAQMWEISREALPTLTLSLISLCLSGELLIHLAKWPVFTRVDKLFILIPILLNLKGNLEGNLSLRMSTSANIGELDVRRTRETLIFGNLALLQVQALIVSLFAGILSFLLGLGTSFEPAKEVPIPSPSVTSLQTSVTAAPAMLIRRLLSPRRVIHHHPPVDPSLKLRNSYFEFVLVIATATLSASVSSAVLGSFMCALVVVTRQMGLNPDNIASPLAGSLGDLLTLTLLGLFSSFMARFEGTILATLILLALAGACAIFFLAAYRNAYVRELLSSGWIPLLIAMFISSGAGVVLDTFVQKFEGFALLVPVLTGLPGAVAAIFVSRTSTALHSGRNAKPSNSRQRSRFFMFGNDRSGISGWISDKYERFAPKWLQDIGGPTEGWLAPCTLFGLGMIVTTAFILFVRFTGQMTFGIPFLLMFITVSSMAFLCALTIAHILTLLLWRFDYDPDIYCLPFITSLVDVIGQTLLVMAYYIAIGLGDSITAAVNDNHK
jgi:solute carrier family 41